jgi:hypothetical protein
MARVAQSGSDAGKRRAGRPVSGARSASGALKRVEVEQTCAEGASWRAGLGRCVHGEPKSRTSQTALARPEWRKRECGARRCGRAGVRARRCTQELAAQGGGVQELGERERAQDGGRPALVRGSGVDETRAGAGDVARACTTAGGMEVHGSECVRAGE